MQSPRVSGTDLPSKPTPHQRQKTGTMLSSKGVASECVELAWLLHYIDSSR